MYYITKIITAILLFTSTLIFNEGGEEIKLPLVIKGSYVGRNCDEFHAFNDTNGKTIGGMNDTINNVLVKLYKSGINTNITNVNIIMDSNLYIVKWFVTIDKSDDGKAWVGFYSRGAGGSDAIQRGDPNIKGNHTTIENCKKSKFINKRGKVSDMSILLDYVYTGNKKCKVRQIFYKYTLENYKPN